MGLAKVNAVVVGSGAGGGVVACQLAEAGLSVVLFERGRWHSVSDERKDDLVNQRNASLGLAYGPDEKKNPRVFVDLEGQEHVISPDDHRYNANAACVGGGTACYGAQAWRFMPQDFQMRSLYGEIEGSTLEDWPITYDDLEPYYEKAEYEIGVSGDVAPNIFQGARKKPLPMPPMEPKSREYEILKPAALRLGLHPFDLPLLINSVPYRGRSACMRIRWCVGFGCETDAKNGTQNTVIPRALATRNCLLRTDCVVKEVLVNDQGRATGVAFFDEHDQLQEQPADLVVVSCGATESARLLLMSKSRLFPEGIGNRHDWVGRNLQGHTYTGATGYFPEDVDCYDDIGPGACLAACDYNHGNEALAGGGMLANEFIRLPIQFVNDLPRDTPRWGSAHKDAMRRYYRHNIAVRGPTQEMPVWDARVRLDPVVKDHWGLPVVRLSGGKHPHTIEIANHQAERAAEWLKEAGADLVGLRRAGPGLSGGQHQAGTCRMGSDPKSSVVDPWHRVHDLDNVFVVDASVHVTNGGFNPVLTIMALAFRAGEHIAKEWRRGGLR
ncbi:MAG: GMC family oxidoreductase [Acidobacteriota bacterium]|jgi:choline dehydrogenase-like flavoprotein